MEAPHLCLLDLVVGFEPPRDEELAPRLVLIPNYSHNMPLYGGWHWGGRQWSESQICIARPRLAPVIESLIGTLERHGLVRRDDNSDEVLETLGQQYPANAGRAGSDDFKTRSGRASESAQVADEPKWIPTELGEQVWTRFHDAGASVPDVWSSQAASD